MTTLAPDLGVARSELPGGLRVVTEDVPGAHSVSLGIWIDIGSRDETGDQAGAAHFLEHLLFKGTRTRTAVEIAEALDAVGGDLNAFTTKEHTCYYAHVLDTDLALAVDVLAEVVTDATLRPPDVETERGVVLEEIAMRDDDPEDLLGELSDEAVFGAHPLGRPVIGTVESVRGMSRETLHAFWRGEYTTPRMVVAAAGNVRHEEFVELVGTALAAASGRAGAASPAGPRPCEPATLAAAGRVVLRPDDTEQAHLMLGVPGLSRPDPRRPALTVLNTAIGGGPSSRLFQEVREQRGLAYSVYSASVGYSDAGAFTVYAGCAPERLEEVVRVVRAVLADVARSGVTPAEVTRAQGNLRGGLLLGLEDMPSRMNRIGRSEIDHGRQRSVAESLERIATVTPEQVAAVAREVLDVPMTAAVLGPYDEVEDLPGQGDQGSCVDRRRRGAARRRGDRRHRRARAARPGTGGAGDRRVGRPARRRARLVGPRGRRGRRGRGQRRQVRGARAAPARRRRARAHARAGRRAGRRRVLRGARRGPGARLRSRRLAGGAAAAARPGPGLDVDPARAPGRGREHRHRAGDGAGRRRRVGRGTGTGLSAGVPGLPCPS